MNGSPSVRVALFIRESGSESPCRWFYVTGIYKSIKGADASAIVYSITETAILHGLRPYNYLAYVMEKISQAPEFGDNSYLNDLLPWSPALPDNLKSNIVRK